MITSGKRCSATESDGESNGDVSVDAFIYLCGVGVRGVRTRFRIFPIMLLFAKGSF